MLVFCLHRRHTSPLPPALLLHRLYQVIALPPTGRWQRVVYWFQTGCKGNIVPGRATFKASVPHGKGNGPVITGNWQPAPVAAGSLVELRGRLGLSQALGLSFASLAWLAITVGSCALCHPIRHWPILAFGIVPFLMLADAQWSLYRAARYFREALQLTELPTE